MAKDMGRTTLSTSTETLKTQESSKSKADNKLRTKEATVQEFMSKKI